MNYKYSNKKESEVIKNYKTDEDKIVIHLLSGDYYEMPLSKESEKMIIEDMLHQASERKGNGPYIETVRKKMLYYGISSAIFTYFTAYTTCGFANMDSKEKRIFYGLLTIANAIIMVVHGKEFYFKHNELNEIKKYSIYLDIREKLETYKYNNNLFNNIEGMDSIPTINTIDDWSMKEMIQLKNNLKLCERYECFCKQAGPKKI